MIAAGFDFEFAQNESQRRELMEMLRGYDFQTLSRVRQTQSTQSSRRHSSWMSASTSRANPERE